MNYEYYFHCAYFIVYLLPLIGAINFDQWGVRPKSYYCAYGSCMTVPEDNMSPRNESPMFNGFDQQTGLGLDACRLTCGAKGHIWPQPTGETRINNVTAKVDIRNIWLNDRTFMATTVSMFNIFKMNMMTQYRTNPGVNQGLSISVNIQATQPNQSLVLTKTDESYTLEIRGCESRSQIVVSIIGGSIWGARHGLETLSQLIGYDDVSESLRIACNVTLMDNAVYPYRGLSLDVSRRFYPLESIKKLLHGMGTVKMNVLHLHLTDSQSFPIAIKDRPQMLYYGSYGPNQGYSRDDLMAIRDFAVLRGILIIPEIDAPSHVGEGWQWGPKQNIGEMLMCFENLPSKTCISTPCGYLNPLNQNVYSVLFDIYREILEIFGNPLDPSSNWFHIGADEVDLDACWNRNEEMRRWMNSFNPPKDGYDLWGLFENTAIKNLKKANKDTLPSTIMWTSHLTNKANLFQIIDQEYHDNIVIESWESAYDPGILKFLNNGLRMIMAPYDAWYLDCGGGWWVGEGGSWCDPVKDWRRMYNYRPTSGFNGTYNVTDPAKRKLILGGEGGIWSETIGPENLDQKVWPRSAAIAERLWSDPDHCWYYANSRMFAMRDRLVRLGINAEPIQPEWCDQNGANCIVDATLWEFYHINPRSTCMEFENLTIPTVKRIDNDGNNGAFGLNSPFASPLIGNDGVVLIRQPTDDIVGHPDHRQATQNAPASSATPVSYAHSYSFTTATQKPAPVPATPTMIPDWPNYVMNTTVDHNLVHQVDKIVSNTMTPFKVPIIEIVNANFPQHARANQNANDINNNNNQVNQFAVHSRDTNNLHTSTDSVPIAGVNWHRNVQSSTSGNGAYRNNQYNHMTSTNTRAYTKYDEFNLNRQNSPHQEYYHKTLSGACNKISSFYTFSVRIIFIVYLVLNFFLE